MDSELNIVKKALTLINAGDYVNAEKVLENGLKEEPKNQKMLNLLGWVLYHRGKFTEMVAVYKKLVKLNPQQSFTMFYNLGKAYYQLGNYSAAIESFHKTIEIVPDHKSAIFYLCLSHAKSGDLRKAKKLLADYKDKFSENVESIADISMQDGLDELTIDEMEEKTELSGKKDRVIYHSMELFGTWSISRKSVVFWDGAFDVELNEEFIVFKGEGKLSLKEKNVVLLLNKRETLWINSNYFIGINRKLAEGSLHCVKQGHGRQTCMYEFNGPAKIILHNIPYMTANVFGSYCIKAEHLLAILGQVEIAFENEIIRVVQGGGKAFLI